MSHLRLEAFYDVVRCDAYSVVLDEFRDDDGRQMMLMHIDFTPERFSASVMKRMLSEWSAFRSCTDAPLYGIEPSPDDDKWERFVSRLGFQNTNSRVDCTDGQSRRLFVSSALKDTSPNEHDEHQGHLTNFTAVECPAAVSN